MRPDAFIAGGSGSGGSIRGIVVGQEAVWNFGTDEIDLFGYAGHGSVFGSKLVGTGYAGFAWNLDENIDYNGPFSTLTVDIVLIEGVQVNLFWETGTMPFTGETWGVSAGYTPGGVGVALSHLQTIFWHEIKFQ